MVVAKKGVLSTYEEPTSTCLLKKGMKVVAKKGVLCMKLRTYLLLKKRMKVVVAKKGVLNTYEEPTSTCLLKKRMNEVVAKKGVLSI